MNEVSTLVFRLGHQITTVIHHIGVVAAATGHGVSAGAAVQPIIAFAADKGVVARIAIKAIVACPAIKDVHAGVTGNHVIEIVAGSVDVSRASQGEILNIVGQGVIDV